MINKYYQTAYDFSINQLSIEIKSQITSKNANELIKLSRSDFMASIQKKICKIFQQKSNEIFDGLTSTFPEKFKEYSENIKSYVKNKCKKEFDNQCISKVIPNISNEVKNQFSRKIQSHFNHSYYDDIRRMNKTNEITNFQQMSSELLNENIRSISSAIISSIEYNTQMNNLQLNIANEVSKNYDRRKGDCNAMDNSQSILDKYLLELEDYERQIYRVCEARVPVSCGGEESWVREGMERERDAKGDQVRQLRQQYDNEIRNLDARANKYLRNETGLANELLHKKLNLLAQELSNRNGRVSELDGQIERAWQPVHSGGGFWKEDRIYLQKLQGEAKQEIEQLQQLILQTRNNIH